MSTICTNCNQEALYVIKDLSYCSDCIKDHPSKTIAMDNPTFWNTIISKNEEN